MHLGKKSVLAAVVFALAVFAPLASQAAVTITNTGYVEFTNEAAVVQAPVFGNTVFVVAANPVLALVKTRDVARGPAGTVVTYQIKVTYPQLGTDCTDDSAAKNVIVRDTIPTGLKFRNSVATDFRVSYNNGTSWTNVTPAYAGGDDVGDISIGTNDIITINLTSVGGDIIEGAGACVAGTARIVEFKAVVQ